MSEVVEVNTLDELEALVAKGDTVIVDFWASWCGPCKKFAPHFVKAAEQADAVFVTVDIEEATEIADEFSIQSVPTVKLFRDGNFEKNLQSRTVIPLLSEISS